MEKTITFNLDPQGRARQAMMGESLTQKNLTFSEDATVTRELSVLGVASLSVMGV